jgi:SAM-dependent methyltransferase
MPGSNTHFYKFRDRLAQFRPIGNHRVYWEQRWSQRAIRETLAAHSKGKLEEYEGIFTRYLPRDLPILEAGCGLGQLVMALSSRGYQVEGVDYADQTIARIQTAAPELNVRVGDVYNLDVRDNTYGGYISLGIFEHNPAGPLAGLKEVRRVLHPLGVGLISVPFLNRERQKWLRRAPVATNPVSSDGVGFYQYYFSSQDFEARLQEAGLQVVEIFPYALYGAVTRDFGLTQWLHEQKFFFWQIHRRITQWCREAPAWMRWRWAHMLMFVCRRIE